jgi:hypothetical protein
VSALFFLAIPLVIIFVGVVVMWLRHRKPTAIDSDVVAFQREMRALSPDGSQRSSRRSSRSQSGGDNASRQD